MNIQELANVYSRLPQASALAKSIGKSSSKKIFLEGLLGSSATMLFGSIAAKCGHVLVFVLQDAEEAGYFYHDLVQVLGDKDVLFFPSSYRRAVKYAQRDAASEILRTEVLARISRNVAIGLPLATEGTQESDNREGACNQSDARTRNENTLLVVSYPEALAELVVSKKKLDERTLVLEKDQTADVSEVTKTLREFGFREVDYVYEPGQFALRGSILDVYSFSCEYPYRFDFFGDDIDSIRTFGVEDQLSKDRRDRVEIVPELAAMAEDKVPFLSFLPKDAILVMKDYLYVRDAVERTYQEGFSAQARMEQLESATEMEQQEIERQLRRESQLVTGAQWASDAEKFRRIEFGHRPSSQPDATIRFNISSQPLFHKNFDLLKKTFENYSLQGYTICVCADSQKQNERLQEILTAGTAESSPRFTPVDKTLHEGFVDNDIKICVFTDHQIFDRFHKFNLKSDKARSGKMALTLKEIQQFEIGDFVVHVDHGVGKFGGLVRMPVKNATGEDTWQEMIKILYNGGGSIYVSIHSLYKVSKYKSQDNGEPPRLSTLGTGQWEKLKERTKKHIKDIARDLIKLYAKRRREKGFAFSPDSYLQHELEASFLYEDTPDQLKATQDVKADMEKQKAST